MAMRLLKTLILVIATLTIIGVWTPQARAGGPDMFGCYSNNFFGALSCSLTGIFTQSKQEYGGYTVTPYGYRPLRQVPGLHHYVPIRPGYTYSKPVYYDQRPEVFGIIPDPRRYRYPWQYGWR